MRLASVSSRPKYLRSPATHPLIMPRTRRFCHAGYATHPPNMPHTHAEYATLVMART